MLIVQRLYIKEFLTVLTVLTVGLSVVLSIVGLVDRIDNFMPHKPSVSLLLKYTLFSIPRYMHYLLPMAMLLSSLFVFSQAIKRREIVIIKAAGGKMKRMLAPFLAIGIILTLFAFVLSEIIVPMSAKKNHEIKNVIEKKEKDITFKEGTLYVKGKDRSIVRISLYIPEKNIAKGMTIFRFDQDGLKQRIDAEIAEWRHSAWKLKDVTLYDIEGGFASKVEEMDYYEVESPKIFQAEAWKAEEMTMVEVVKYQQRLNEAGFKNIKLTVDISSRLSYPLVNLFMLLLGISLSIGGNASEQRFLKIFSSRKVKEGAMGSGIIAAGLGLLISLIYWFGYTLFLSLGYAGTIPPIAAPWVVPFIFGAVSVYLYNQIQE